MGLLGFLGMRKDSQEAPEPPRKLESLQEGPGDSGVEPGPPRRLEGLLASTKASWEDPSGPPEGLQDSKQARKPESELGGSAVSNEALGPAGCATAS